MFKWFVSEAWLTATILAVVLGAAALIDGTSLLRLVGGMLLLAGCLAVLVLSVCRDARGRSVDTGGHAIDLPAIIG